MADDWCWMTAGELGRGIGEGRIDPVALTDAHLSAIDAHPLGPRIYARTTPDRARAEARAAAARARTGQRRGPLDGVPVSWKDLFDTAGTATEAGSALLAGRVPDRDAAVLRTASAAGLACLGKTHMSELAFSGLGYNPVTGWPPARSDPEAVAGGSSSGAAASVAHGLAPAAVGSDTGGSVRVPAAWNDLVGLKTTHRLLPRDGVVALVESLDTVGPLTRSVSDAAAMLAALGGGRAPDLAGARLTGTRLMVLESVALDTLEPAVASAFDAALSDLEAAGATLVRRTLPWLADAMALSGVVFATEAYGIWRETIEADPEAMFPEILARFRGGRDVAGADYVAAWRSLRRYRRDWAAATAGVDAVVLPTCPILPPSAETLTEAPDVYAERNAMSLRNTRIANMLGLSALTLPTRTPAAGLSFFTPPGAEGRLLRLGAAAEPGLT